MEKRTEIEEVQSNLSVDSNADSIAVSVFVDWLGLSNTESEANPNNNLMMRRAGLSSSLKTEKKMI